MKNFYQELLSNQFQQMLSLIKGIEKVDELKINSSRLKGNIVQHINSSTLHHYPAKGLPILIVPSMINKAYVLDLPSGSLIEELKVSNFNPYVIEWGDPKEAEVNMDLNDYINQRLDKFVDFITLSTGIRPIILGYCMGGIMSILYNSKYKHKISALILLATPWNFKVDNFVKFPINRLRDFIGDKKLIPKEFFQLGFYLTKFNDVNQKYISFANSEIDEPKFIEIESWVNDGMDMPKAVFTQLIENFIHNNDLMKGRVSLANINYNIKDTICPILTIAATYDTVVPIESTLSIKDVIKTEIKCFKTGHIGLVNSWRAQTAMAISEWLNQKNINKRLLVC